MQARLYRVVYKQQQLCIGLITEGDSHSLAYKLLMFSIN